MNQKIEKLFTIFLIILILLLLLNEFYIIQFSKILKDIFSYITLVLIIFSSTKEMVSGKSGFNKFFNLFIFLSIFIGGIVTILNKQFNLLIYLALICSICYSIVNLIFKKS